MIKSLSPYYIEIPFVSPLTSLTCTDYTFQLFVWNGSKSTPPATASYEITKTNPTGSTANDEINIANLISDFINFSPREGTGTELIDGENQLWVKWQTFYTTSNPLDATTPSNTNTQLMVKGYAYGLDGENQSTPTNKILLSGTEFKVSRTGIFVLPIEIAETTITSATLTIDDITFISGDQYSLEFTPTGNIDEVYYRYKLDGEVDWVLGLESSVTSPFDITLPTIAGTYNVQIYAYDNDNAEFVYSNIFNVVVS